MTPNHYYHLNQYDKQQQHQQQQQPKQLQYIHLVSDQDHHCNFSYGNNIVNYSDDDDRWLQLSKSCINK